MRTSASCAALVNASLTPFTSLASSIKTSEEALHVIRLALYAIPATFPSVPRGAANTPAIAVP